MYGKHTIRIENKSQADIELSCGIDGGLVIFYCDPELIGSLNVTKYNYDAAIRLYEAGLSLREISMREYESYDSPFGVDEYFSRSMRIVSFVEFDYVCPQCMESHTDMTNSSNVFVTLPCSLDNYDIEELLSESELEQLESLLSNIN